MRRVIGLVLAGLGMCLIVGAILLPTYVAGQTIKFPLNEYETATLTGSNMQYFNAKLLTEETGVSMIATYTIKGVPSEGNGSTAVWDEYSYAKDVTNDYVQSQSVQRSAFNRTTGQLIDCCGANLNGNTGIRQSGIVGWVFPMGAKKQTYMVFDTTLDKPEPYVYSGTADTDGVQTYKFVEDIAPTQFATLTVPGFFVGSSATTIAAGEYYQIKETYYVDPVTGALLNVNEDETLTLHNPVTGVSGVVLYNGDLQETPASLTQIVGLDNTGRSELTLLTLILPLVLGIVGAILVVVGFLLNRKRGYTAEEEGPVPLSALAPPSAEQTASAEAPDGASPDGTSPDGTSPDGASPNGAVPDEVAHDGASEVAARHDREQESADAQDTSGSDPA